MARIDVLRNRMQRASFRCPARWNEALGNFSCLFKLTNKSINFAEKQNTINKIISSLQATVPGITRVYPGLFI